MIPNNTDFFLTIGVPSAKHVVCTISAQWSMSFSADVLVADPRSDHFAAFEADGKGLLKLIFNFPN